MQRDDTRPDSLSATPHLSPLDLARFWSRVAFASDFQCWEWQGRKNHRGYGRFKTTMAHRIAYALIKGAIPDGQIVRHRCDNPGCCNPKHLEIGTHSDNMGDALDRGRFALGQDHGRTTLTEEQALYIKRNPDRKKQRVLAEEFGVAVSTVSYIRRGRSWSRLPK